MVLDITFGEYSAWHSPSADARDHSVTRGKLRTRAHISEEEFIYVTGHLHSERSARREWPTAAQREPGDLPGRGEVQRHTDREARLLQAAHAGVRLLAGP